MQTDYTENYKVIVIGGGQAGLSMGYYLAKSGIPYIILDASERVGDPGVNAGILSVYLLRRDTILSRECPFPPRGIHFRQRMKWPITCSNMRNILV